MATEISLDLINQLQVSLRREAKLSSIYPVDDNSDASFPNLPTTAEAISELDPSAPYLRCRNCKGKLLRGIESLICVFCGKQQRTNDNPPDPIKFTSCSGYKLFLSSLNLDGSEIVEPLKDTNESIRKAKEPVVKGIAVSKFLDLEIQWSPLEEKSINSRIGDRNPLNLRGINLDDNFVEGSDVSIVEVAESKFEEDDDDDDFKDPRSLSLFDSESQGNVNVGLFKGKDIQENVSSEKHENLGLFSERDVQGSSSLAEQGNFGFFEEKNARHDANLSLFEGKDAQRSSSSKNEESFGFFEGKDAQRSSSSKNEESFGFFEGKDAQRNSSSKEESFGFFEGKDGQRNSSSKEGENLGLFESKDDQRNSSSKEDVKFGLFEDAPSSNAELKSVDEKVVASSSDWDSDFQSASEKKISDDPFVSSKEGENIGLFDGKDGQRNSSLKEDVKFGLFEDTLSSNAELKSVDDKVVASSSDWDSDFQSASEKKISDDPFVGSQVDLSAHMDSVFGSGKDLLYEKPTASDWLQDDLFGKTQKNDSPDNDKNEQQVINGNESSSMNIDWIGDDLWQTSEKKAKTPTNDNDNNDDDWNDFASSANSKTHDNPLSQTMKNPQEDLFAGLEQVKNNVKEQSEVENQNTGQEDDLFGNWDSFTSLNVLQTPLQPPTNHVNQSAEQNPEINLFGENNNHRNFDSDLFLESIGDQTNSEEVKAMSSGTSNLERTSDSTGKDLVSTTTKSPKSKNQIAEELMSQMHDLSFMLETKLSVPSPPVSKTE